MFLLSRKIPKGFASSFPKTFAELRHWDKDDLIEFDGSDMVDRVVADVLAKIREELVK